MTKRPKSILIIKLSAIGDVVHSLPLLDVLRDHFPDATLDWVVEEESSPIIEGHQGIDQVIISRRKSWQRRLVKGRKRSAVVKEIIQFLRALRSKEYDLVIDLQGLFKSAMLAGLSKGKRKIGPNWGREGSQLFFSERPYLADSDKHAVDKYLKVAEYLKCEKDSWRGEIPIHHFDKASVDKLIHDNGIENKRLVAINPVAKWETKLWDPIRFAALADKLQKELSCKIIFTGSERDQLYVDKVMEKMEEKSLNLAGRTSLKELAYLYSKCQLLISTDTGPMHIAAAMGCPVVALFGPTAPWRTGPYGEGHRVVREVMECSPCYKKRCEDMTCMKDITVDKVFVAVREMLGSEWSKPFKNEISVEEYHHGH